MTFQELKLLGDLSLKYFNALYDNDGLSECIDVAEHFMGMIDVYLEQCEEVGLSDNDDVGHVLEAM